MALEHVVAVMPGSGPFVLVEATVSNTGVAPADVTFIEAWGTAMIHQLTGNGWGGWSSMNNMSSMLDRRE